MEAFFGAAGKADSFKGKSSLQIPEYLSKFPLNAYEYQCGRGVNVTQENAIAFGKEAEKYGIKLSLHAPYFISLSSVEESKRIGSVKYITDSAAAAKAMGATRIVVHSGSCSKMSREEALSLAKETLKMAKAELVNLHLDDVCICPETMGKINQLGTLDEVMELCLVDESFIPCIDFGHLNARTMGGLATKEDFAKILDTIENKLGKEKLNSFHAHFSKIEYSSGGEKKHLTFADTQFGPDYTYLVELIAQKDIAPTIICESAGTQSEDAFTMRELYKKLCIQ